MSVPVLADFNGGTIPTTLINAWLAAIRFALPLQVTKLNDESVSSNAAFQNDDELFLPVAANSKYEFELTLLIKAANASNGGMNVQFTAPSGTTGLSTAIWRWGGNTSPGQQTNANGGVTGLTLTTSPVYYGTKGTLATGANAGTFQFQWCQSASNANASIVMAGSTLSMRQVA